MLTQTGESKPSMRSLSVAKGDNDLVMCSSSLIIKNKLDL